MSEEKTVADELRAWLKEFREDFECQGDGPMCKAGATTISTIEDYLWPDRITAALADKDGALIRMRDRLTEATKIGLGQQAEIERLRVEVNRLHLDLIGESND